MWKHTYRHAIYTTLSLLTARKNSINFICHYYRNCEEEMYLARNLISLTKSRMSHKFVVNKTSLMKNGKDSSIVLVRIIRA